MRKAERPSPRPGDAKTQPARLSCGQSGVGPVPPMGRLQQLVSTLSWSPHRAVEAYVQSREAKLVLDCNINLEACSVVQLKYMVLRLLEAEQENMDTVPRASLSLEPGQVKKTNVYIDIDFTEFLERAQAEGEEKDRMIERLQEMMVDKDNEIEVLESENEELKYQIEEIARQQLSQQHEKQDIQGRVQASLNENLQLREQVEDLRTQMDQLREAAEEDPDELLRRCLLVQAVGIEQLLAN